MAKSTRSRCNTVAIYGSYKLLHLSSFTSKRLFFIKIMKTKLLLLLLVSFAITLRAERLQTVSPEQVGMSLAQLRYADQAINQAIHDGQPPGAVLAVVRHGKLAYLKAYGNRQTYPSTEPMTPNTIFDMASCTKPMATALSVMILVERGLLRINDPVKRYLPEFKSWNSSNKDSADIRIIDLLTHTSGLPAYASVNTLQKQFGTPNPQKLMQYIAQCQRDFKPETAMQYSCLNYITLQNIVERVSKQSLRTFAAENIFIPLGMNHTDFLPYSQDKNGRWKSISVPRWIKNGEREGVTPIAPTEKQPDGSVKKGQVHDPLACVVNGGISGNAGLFSCAEDVATLCAMLQNGGTWGGKQILSPLTVKAMRTIPDGFATFGRSLGWDVSSPYASNKGDLLSSEAYGHTGYTGTSIVIDPVNDISIILLTNSVHPTDHTNVIRLRAQVSNAVAASITNEKPKHPDYYYARMRKFEVEPPIQPTDIVMLGNSITEGGANWAQKLDMPNVVNRGISGDIAQGINERLYQILPHQPAKIFLLIGVNDISHDLTTDSIVNDIRRVVERIRNESPRTRLYLQSLLPIREATGRWKRLQGKTEQIPEINARLEALAREKHLTFINLFPHFTEPGNHVLREELTYDGLHLSKAGYEVWVKILKKYL